MRKKVSDYLQDYLNQDPIRFQMDIFAGEKNKKLCSNEMT